MVGAIPGLVVLGYTRKQSDQAMGSKMVSSTPPWLLFVCLFGFLFCFVLFFETVSLCNSSGTLLVD